MSRSSLNARLEALEASAPAAKPVMVWRDATGSETVEQAVAKDYPGGVPLGAPVYVLEWGMDDGQ